MYDCKAQLNCALTTETETAQAPEAPAALPKLTGKALLEKIKEIGAAPKNVVAHACGYSSVKKDGTTKYMFVQFQDAVLAAKGIAFEPAESVARAGRTPTYHTKVGKSGSIIIGTAYAEMQQLPEGQALKITLLDDGGFQLTPVEPDPEGESEGETETEG